MRASVVVALAGLATLSTGCQAGGAGVSTASGQDRPARATRATSGPVEPGTGGPGSVTFSISGAVNGSGNVATTVTCSEGPRNYQAAISGTPGEVSVASTVLVAPYSGPGSYQSAITLKVTQGDVEYTLPLVPKAPATITATGGSYTLTGTAEGGGTLTATISWACS